MVHPENKEHLRGGEEGMLERASFFLLESFWIVFVSKILLKQPWFIQSQSKPNSITTIYVYKRPVACVTFDNTTSILKTSVKLLFRLDFSAARL